MMFDDTGLIRQPLINVMFFYLSQDDSTYETQSRISFVASRFENGESITCEANNQVLDHYQEEPQRAAMDLAVLCKLKQQPSHVTVCRFPENCPIF
jgi:hypothetical protein